MAKYSEEATVQSKLNEMLEKGQRHAVTMMMIMMTIMMMTMMTMIMKTKMMMTKMTMIMKTKMMMTKMTMMMTMMEWQSTAKRRLCKAN